MNWRFYLAMLSRYAHVARRNFRRAVTATFSASILFSYFGRDGVAAYTCRRRTRAYCCPDHGNQYVFTGEGLLPCADR